jgi:low temperature requirement protein LtrA
LYAPCKKLSSAGKGRAAGKSLAAGVASTSFILLIAFYLPENFPNMALPVAYCFGMRQLVRYLQGGAIDNHLKAGGRKGSWGLTVAVGLGCLVIIFGLIIGLMMTSNFE